jgi:DNA-binding transcriptional LysR family regulator
LVSSPTRFPPRIGMQLLSEEPMVFVCRPDHRLAQRASVSLNDLADEDLIGFPLEFGLRRLVEDAFTANGITARTPYEVALEYSVAANLVRHGLGSIFMPASEASRVPDLRAIDVQPAILWTIYLASAEQIGPASAKLAEMLLESAAVG